MNLYRVMALSFSLALVGCIGSDNLGNRENLGESTHPLITSGVVVFDDATDAGTNLRTARTANQGAVNNTKVGIVQLGSDTSGTLPGATANYATVIGGDQCSSTAPYAVSGGYQSTAAGEASSAFGSAVLTTGYAAHAEGRNTFASAEAAHVEGWNTVARARYSHSEGSSTVAGSANSPVDELGCHAEGAGTSASKGMGTHAEGYGAEAYYNAAHAEGVWTRAYAGASHSEGEDTYAKALRAHSEGYSTTAGGIASHSQNMNTQAQGDASTSMGISSKATRTAQWALSGGPFANDGNTTYGEQPNAPGDAQTSLLVLRGGTIGNSVGEAATLFYGHAGTEFFHLEPSRAYSFKVNSITSGWLSGTFVVRSITRRATAWCCDVNGGAVIVSSVEESSDGSVTAAPWTLSVLAPYWNQGIVVFQMSTGLTQAATKTAARVEFTEVVIP